MYCHADIPSHRASNTILSNTSVQSFILTTDDQREVHWTVVGDFCPSHSWCWITFCHTEQTHHVTFVYGLPTRNVCNRWCIFKRNKSLTGIKRCKDLNFISNSYETLSDFGCVNVAVRQLRSKASASAEQLKLMISPLHALSFMAELINWTFSGLSEEERDNL